MSGEEVFVTVNVFWLISQGQRCYGAAHATNLQPPMPLHPTSCCAPIKAELIKPQVIASAGGGRRREGGKGGYTLAFIYHF